MVRNFTICLTGFTILVCSTIFFSIKALAIDDSIRREYYDINTGPLETPAREYRETEKKPEISTKSIPAVSDPDLIIDTVTGMEFILIKGGCFEMGDSFSNEVNHVDYSTILSIGDEKNSAKPVHLVCIDDFYIGKYEVTQGVWETIMADNPSFFSTGFNTGPNYPVENVNWHDIQKFLTVLNQKSNSNYRLPTEAEWEYAARSGGKEERFAGFSNKNDLYLYANFCDVNCKMLFNTEDQEDNHEMTSPVGSFKPNGLDIFDMSGNVWELCSDWFDPFYYRVSPQNNPQGPPDGLYRVCRGGSWGSRPRDLSTSFRYYYSPDSINGYLGFRLAFTP